MPTAACRPCRERKLKCDRQPPRCSNCVRARLLCPGFAKELSWPKPTNKKRCLVGPRPHVEAPSTHGIPTRWAHVRFEDIEAHRHVSSVQSLQNSPIYHVTSPLVFKLGPSWTPTRLKPSDLTLLQYFQTEAALAITCGSADEYLLAVVTRLAFHDDSASSQAVLHSVLAVASIRRYGSNMETIARQGTALRLLESSAQAGLAGNKVVQHIAAGVLLCCFEIFSKDQTSGPWSLYISSTKKLLKGLQLDKHVNSNEFLAMTNWLYHHDVHAQFGLRHWRKEGNTRRTIQGSPPRLPDLGVRENTKSMTEIVRNISKLTDIEASSHQVLWPMADILENVVDSCHPKYHDDQYRQELASLEDGLESILNGRFVAKADHRTPTTPVSANDFDYFTLEIYRLSALVYLERSSRNFSGTSAKIDTWVNLALDLMRTLGTLRHSFPVFIIGCEARTDEQRIIILDCIKQNQNFRITAAMQIAQDMVQSAWAMEDLETDRELDYMTKLDTVISGCETLPSFA